MSWIDEALFWLTAALAIPPFILMYVAWVALRIKKLPLARWKRYQRAWFILGLALLVFGSALYLIDRPGTGRTTMTALVGGMLNALTALFQRRIIDVLTRPPR